MTVEALQSSPLRQFYSSFIHTTISKPDTYNRSTNNHRTNPNIPVTMAISELDPEVIAANTLRLARETAAAIVLEAQKAEEKRLREAEEKINLEYTKEVAANVASPTLSSPMSLGSSMEEMNSASEYSSPKRETPGVESDNESDAFVSQYGSPRKISASPSSDGGVRLRGDDSSDREAELGEDGSSNGGVVLEGSEREDFVEGKVKDKGKGKARK